MNVTVGPGVGVGVGEYDGDPVRDPVNDCEALALCVKLRDADTDGVEAVPERVAVGVALVGVREARVAVGVAERVRVGGVPEGVAVVEADNEREREEGVGVGDATVGVGVMDREGPEGVWEGVAGDAVTELWVRVRGEAVREYVCVGICEGVCDVERVGEAVEVKDGVLVAVPLRVAVPERTAEQDGGVGLRLIVDVGVGVREGGDGVAVREDGVALGEGVVVGVGLRRGVGLAVGVRLRVQVHVTLRVAVGVRHCDREAEWVGEGTDGVREADREGEGARVSDCERVRLPEGVAVGDHVAVVVRRTGGVGLPVRVSEGLGPDGLRETERDGVEKVRVADGVGVALRGRERVVVGEGEWGLRLGLRVLRVGVGPEALRVGDGLADAAAEWEWDSVPEEVNETVGRGVGVAVCVRAALQVRLGLMEGVRVSVVVRATGGVAVAVAVVHVRVLVAETEAVGLLEADAVRVRDGAAEAVAVSERVGV